MDALIINEFSVKLWDFHNEAVTPTCSKSNSCSTHVSSLYSDLPQPAQNQILILHISFPVLSNAWIIFNFLIAISTRSLKLLVYVS